MEVDVVFSDLDGTLIDGDLGPLFLTLIDFLKKRNIPLVVTTGRPSGWGVFMLSHFSYLDQFYSEGGGALTERDKSYPGELKGQVLIPKEDVVRLEEITEKVIKDFKVELSCDSSLRITDRAIEREFFKQDLPKMQKLIDFLERENVSYSVSNIHLNFWIGQVSKWQAIEHYCSRFDVDVKRSLFFGDSTNDESVFEKHPCSVGVSNISEVWDQLQFKPTHRLEGQLNAGPKGVLNFLQNNL